MNYDKIQLLSPFYKQFVVEKGSISAAVFMCVRVCPHVCVRALRRA